MTTEPENLYTTVFNAAPFLVFQKDTRNNILRANRAAADLLSVELEDLENTPSSLWFPDDVDNYYADDLEVIRSNRAKLGIIEPKVIDGEKRWFQTDKLPTHAQDGSADGVVVIAQDVTERLQFQKQIQHAQRMDSVGRLAGGVTHDLNNLLTVIGGFTERAQESWRAGKPMDDSLDLVHEACSRAAHLTSQLLGFARQQMSRPEPTDLNTLCTDLYSMIRSMVPEDIEVVMLPKASRNAMVDPAQIEQVLLNLVFNARDAIAGEGKITIGTQDTNLEAKDLVGHLDVAAGAYTKLFVTDTGTGLENDVASRAFEPFFTTKGSGGSGLGLAVCYGIIKQHHGHIALDSVPGKGATFHLYLPSTRSSAVKQVAAPVKNSQNNGHERILIVEDEKRLRSMLKDVLSKLGYSLTVCASAEQALIDEGIHDLLLTDVGLSGASGLVLAQELSQLGRVKRVLLISGYARESVQRSCFNSWPLLEKPFSLDELSIAVRHALDRS
ncbi:MAG: ATP-binding protein [Granulosicoccus sp.]